MRYDLTVTLLPSEEVCHIGWTVRDHEDQVVIVGTVMGSCLDGHSVETALAYALEQCETELERAGGVQGSLLDPNRGEAPMSVREF